MDSFKLKTKITSSLRQISRTWPARHEALRRAKAGQYYVCCKCDKLHKKEKVQVDHKTPVGGFKGCWNTYINNLFCDVSNLEVLCIGCHQEKTNEERAVKKTQT
jgi:hypothetical protein